MWNSGDPAGDAPSPVGSFPSDAPRSDGGQGTPDTVSSDCPDAADGDEDAIVAELAVEHRDVVLAEAIHAAPDVTVEPNYRTSDDRSSILVFTAHGGPLEEFDAALATDHTVRDPLLVAATDDTRAYRVRYAPATLRFTPVLADVGALLYDARSEGRGWSYHARFPSRAAFATFRKYCSTNGATLKLARLYQEEPSRGGCDLGLTAQQWKTLAIAREMGYFEVPRGTTQEELADRLGVSPSAVSQRIRRATNQLLAASLDSSQSGNDF